MRYKITFKNNEYNINREIKDTDKKEQINKVASKYAKDSNVKELILSFNSHGIVKIEKILYLERK